MALSKIDKTGRVYLPNEIREAAGIADEELLEIKVERGLIILRRRKKGFARGSRGVFRVKKHLEDVDVAIREASLRAALGELNEVRRR